MSPARRLAGRAVAALAGAVIGTVAVLAAGGVTSPDRSEPSRSPRVSKPASPPSTKVHEMGGSRNTTVMLAWSPQGLPSTAERVLRHTKGVVDTTVVRAGVEWIRSSRGPDGTTLDDPPAGLAIPFEVAVIKPKEYARFVPPAERGAVLALGANRLLLAETAAELRGGGAGLKIDIGERTRTVTGVVSDIATNGYEALTRGPVRDAWGDLTRFMLLHVSRDSIGRVERTIRSLMRAPGQVFRVRSQGETPFMRFADAVVPQMLIKKTFGEFAARPLATGMIEVDRRWEAKNIRTERVPLLGRVTCHRAIFPQLRDALKEVISDGLAYTVNPSDFGGCYVAKMLNTRPGGALSHHTWGIAFDINVHENLFGTKPDIDKGLVRIMEAWGFTWGGRWLIPDGMHFEWVRFP